MAVFPRKVYEPEAKGPLAGVRVVDLSRLVAGNTLTMLLADFGAEVTKVEPPAGDTFRAWQTRGVPTYWKQYARNKRSLCLDFRKPGAREILLRLAESAAIFVESFRPGTLEEMGLAPDALHARNPKLIIVRISGWGQEGPYRRRPGFGTLIEGLAGFASMNGFADRAPVLPPIHLADTIASLYGAVGTMIALRDAERTGRGQVIDLPLLDPLFAVLGPQVANYRLSGKVRRRSGSRSPNVAPRNVYRTRDEKWVCLSAPSQKMVERLFRAIGRADAIDDRRFKTNVARVKHVGEVDAMVGAAVAERTLAENMAFFDKEDVTVGPVYDISQAIEDPHVSARELAADYPDPEMEWFPMSPVLPRLMRTPGAIRARAPNLGEHNKSVLAEIGIDDDAYAELLRAGVASEGDAKDVEE